MTGRICFGCGGLASGDKETCGSWRCLQRVTAAAAARELALPSATSPAAKDRRKLLLLELGDEELIANVRKVFELGPSWKPGIPLNQKERERFRSSLVLGIDLGWH